MFCVLVPDQCRTSSSHWVHSWRPGAKTIKKNTNLTQNKSQTHHAKQYEVASFLSTDCELSTETCSKNVYSLGPWSSRLGSSCLTPSLKCVRRSAAVAWPRNSYPSKLEVPQVPHGFCPPAVHENMRIVQSTSDKSIWLLHI